MLRLKVLVLTAAMFIGQMAVAPTAEAGPLLDWLRGKRCSSLQTRSQSACQAPQVAPSRQVAQFQGTANPHNLQPGQCARTCNKVCSRTVVNYVPTTAYRTNWKQVPVTQYRAQTSSDPCTGCSVTCMRPCTSYTWQMQRVPYTTYRPVYRTQNYTVPVTTITNDCATGTCGSPCATGTCGGGSSTVSNVPIYAQPQTLPQSTSVIAPNGTLGTGGGFQPSGSGAFVPEYNRVPADTAPFVSPSLNPQNSQRPIIDRIETLPPANFGSPAGSTTRAVAPAAPLNNVYPINPAPAINTGNFTADTSPIRKKWDYSPVRLASYTTTEKSNNRLNSRQPERKQPIRISGSFQPTAQKSAGTNSAWETVEW